MFILKALYKNNIFDILVDEDIYDELKSEKIFISTRGYPCFNIGHGRENRKNISLHRYILKAQKGMIVDHINRDKFDARRENLRLVNKYESIWNRGKNKNKKNKHGIYSKYIGVRWHPLGHGYWRSSIRVNGKYIHLGLFISEQEAAIAYNNAVKKYRNEKGVVNVI